MSAIAETAKQFFDACETGKGWEGCKVFCHEDASFASQAEPLAEMTTLTDYADWMRGLLTIIPDGSYEVRAFASDNERNSVSAYGVFSGTHTGEGGPAPATSNSVNSDYVYVMEFEGDKIRPMTKIWNSGWALNQLGWG